MKAVGYALVIAAVVVGLGVLANLVSRMNEEQCARQCPENRAALQTKVELGPFALRMCNCGEVQK